MKRFFSTEIQKKNRFSIYFFLPRFIVVFDVSFAGLVGVQHFYIIYVIYLPLCSIILDHNYYINKYV